MFVVKTTTNEQLVRVNSITNYIRHRVKTGTDILYTSEIKPTKSDNSVGVV